MLRYYYWLVFFFAVCSVSGFFPISAYSGITETPTSIPVESGCNELPQPCPCTPVPETISSAPSPTPTRTPYWISEETEVCEPYPAPYLLALPLPGDTYDVTVRCRDINTKIVAVHPITNDLCFPKQDYSGAVDPYPMLKVSPEEEYLYIPNYGNASLFTMPFINEFGFYPCDMKIDRKGIFYLLGFNYKKKDMICLLACKSDGSYETVFSLDSTRYTGNSAFTPSFHILNKPNLATGSNQDDLLFFTWTARKNPEDPIHNQLYRIFRDGNNYKNELVWENNTLEICRFIVKPDGELYLLEKQGKIYHLKNDKNLELFAELPQLQPQESYSRIEYYPADAAFYVYRGNTLYRISQDGKSITTVLKNVILYTLSASPDGRVLYTICLWYKCIYPAYCSIQAIRKISPPNGDINIDLMVNDQDVFDLLKVYQDGIHIPKADLRHYDLNSDGAITPQDAQDLWKRIHPPVNR